MPSVNSRIGKEVGCHHEELVNVYSADIGDGTRIGTFSEVGGATIGKGCVIGAYVFISPGCKVGDFVFLGPKCALLNDLYPSIKGDDFVPNGVTIEDGAVLGACVTVLPGVTIGANARVGAGAVVNKNVPPNTTVIGFPAQEREDVWRPNGIDTLGPPRPEAKTIWHDEGGVYGPITREDIAQNVAELEAYQKSIEESVKQDLNAYSPFSKKEHKIASAPAVSSDHPYSKLFEKDRFNKEHGHLSNGASYTKTTFKDKQKCDEYDCKNSCCDGSDRNNCIDPAHNTKYSPMELPPAIDVTEWVGRADEPVYCRELPEGFDWEKAGVPRVTAERLRALIDADEELILSKTKAHKKHRIPDRLPLDGDDIGLNLGFKRE